jgi:hypothetical protein
MGKKSATKRSTSSPGDNAIVEKSEVRYSYVLHQNTFQRRSLDQLHVSTIIVKAD